MSGEAQVQRPVAIDGEALPAGWAIAVEAPVEVRVNGAPWTVMLASPVDVDDLALGLALTEGLVREAADVVRIDIARWLDDVTVDLTVDAPRLEAGALRTRALPGNSGCGLCGLESLAAFRASQDARHHHRRPGVRIADAAVARAWRELPAHQPVNRATHSVHAAAWCDPEGGILLVREDVGRHNALDKLVGALARSGHRTGPGFVAMTSRCSYELVYKAAVAGASLLATISAPTSLALTWAETLGLTLACAGPARGVVRFPQEVAHAGG